MTTIHLRRIAFGIFVILFAVYLLTYSGRIHVVDEAYMMAVTESITKGRLDINQVASMQWGFDRIGQVGIFAPSGDLFCKKGLGVSLAGVPLFWLASILGRAGAVHAALLTNAILTAVTGSILFSCLTALGFSRRTSLTCALIFGLATLAWPYARLFFAEPIAAMGLLIAFYGCVLFHRKPEPRSASLCGLGMGVTIAGFSAGIIGCLILLGGLGCTLLKRSMQRRERLNALGGWIIGLAGPLIVVSLYNCLRFGSPLDTGWRLMRDDFNLWIHKGLLGSLLSPARGLLFYSPSILLALPGYLVGFRQRKFGFSLTAMLCIVYLLFYAAWKNWHAGWSWGPRYLVPVLPLMIVPVAPLLERLQSRGSAAGYILVIILIIISACVQIIGVAGNYVETEFILEERGINQADGWFYRGRVALFDPAASPLIVQAQNVWQGRLDWSWAASGRIDGLVVAICGLVLLVGIIALWSAYKAYPGSHFIAHVAVCALLVSTSVVVVRATRRPFYDIESDGRLKVLSHIVAHAETGDAVISTVPYLYELMMDRYPLLPPVYGFPREAEYPETRRLLERAVQRETRLWFLSVWTLPADPNNRTEFWLYTHTFPLQKQDFGGHRLILFTTPVEPMARETVGVVFENSIRLACSAIAWRNANTLQLTLEWRSLQPCAKDYQVFVHVYDSAGNLIQQADHAPVGGFRPTSTWKPGEIVTDRIALELPRETARHYKLAVGLYDWLTGERLAPFSESEGRVLLDGRVWLTVPTER